MKELLRLSAAVSCVLLTGTALAQQALVRSFDNPNMEVGQAYLTHYGDRCLAVLPTHVVKETNNVAAFLREGPDVLIGESATFADLGDDVSLADIDGGISGDCGYSSMAVSRAVSSRIRANAVAAVRSVNGDGSIAQLAVTIIDDDGQTFLRVQPTNDANQLRKGQSGSLLMSGDTPVGMLLSVDSRFGVGKVIRFDQMFSKIDAFVAGNPRSTVVAAAPEMSADQTQDDAEPDGRITSWSVMPVDAEHRASNLLATGDSPGWAARVDKWPVIIEMDIRGDRVAIAGFELDATSIENPGTLPGSVEFMISATESGRRWRSIAGGDARYADGVAQFPIAPSWARHVRLVINSSIDGGNSISLGRLRVIPAD